MYIAPANTAAVSGASISSTAFNTLETDIGTEITNSLDRGGRSSMTAALPMGGQKITGAADPTVATDVATKNYVDTTTAAFFSTGDIKLTLKTAPDAGWLLFDDGTFGSATSGSSNSNNAANQALFTLLFNNLIDAWAPILTSGGGATTRAAQTNAASAWAANCRMSLPKTLGRALGIAGSGSGLTTRALAQLVGVETAVLTATNIPPIASSAVNTITVFPQGTNTGITYPDTTGTISDVTITVGGGPTHIPASTGSWTGTNSISGGNTITVNSAGTNSTPFSIVQPEVFLNAMVKV